MNFSKKSPSPALLSLNRDFWKRNEVAFVESERLIGDGAKNQAAMNPANTIFDAKRLIGRRFTDSKVQDDMKLWSFRVIQAPSDTPRIVVSYKGQDKQFFPEEISSMILAKMKETADSYLGNFIHNTSEISSMILTKIFVGRRFTDSKVQDDMKLWSFRVIQAPSDTPRIVVSYKGQDKQFFLEEISSMILTKMKETADSYLGNFIHNTSEISSMILTKMLILLDLLTLIIQNSLQVEFK
ncbi:hypothetical protein LXL04_037426 [Taraxacum kok-saghyz]